MIYLSICAIVRNEAPYITEWLQFHRKQGVEHFFIYENYSDDETYELLKGQPDITLERIKDVNNKPQTPAYKKFLIDHGHKTKWCAVLDCDEFLYHRTMQLPEALKDYEDSPALAVNWYFYGSNGETEYKPFPVLERFPKRELNVDKHVKSIIQPARTLKTGLNAHYFILDGKAVDENMNELPSEYYHNHNCSNSLFRINHYHVKSWEEYQKRKVKGTVDVGIHWPPEKIKRSFDCHDINEIEDLEAWRMMYGPE